MEALSEDQVRSLDTPTAFTDVFREQVGALLKMDLSDVADLPFCGASPGKNLFATALTTPIPDNIYGLEACADGTFAPWVYRFGFTPTALNEYSFNYDCVHEKGSFPKKQFIDEIRRAKNCGYKKRSRQRSKNALTAGPRGRSPTPLLPTATPPPPTAAADPPRRTSSSPASPLAAHPR